ncbi:MAG: sodium/solute symporter [Phycisphaerae bacterium]|nr:sodium/solute symporter [Phycisphaerae bacterium]MDD5381043.1 sodium/solute symporter [Phycisphaerae bacterium]
MIHFSLAQNIAAAIGQTDLIIVGSAILLLFVISYIFGREEKDINDYFLGSRKIPSIVACLSFVATEVSALTIVGVPATAFSENWEYLQFFIGSAAARIAVAFLFIPVFYKYNCTSIYEFLRHRFGPETQYAGSIFFFITRLISSGIRLYAACMGVGIIMGWSLAQTILVFTAVSIIFIAFGGIKAVVWAGAYQAIVFFAAGAAILTYLSLHINGGLSAAWQTAGEAGRLSIFNFKFDLNNPTTFWAGSINAFFIGLAVFGTDQELMQRLLTVRTRKTSQKTIIMTILAALPILCIYLGIGTLLYVFYQQNPDIIQPGRTKEVLSHFVTNSLPAGLKGLMLSAIILASIDSPLSSLASSFVTDIYRPLIKKTATEKHYLMISRAGVVAFGVILATIAFSCESVENILWFAFEIFSLTGGATLGVFILGVLTRRRANLSNVIAMIISTLSVTALLLMSHKGYIKLAWSWLIVIGTIITLILNCLFSCIKTKERPQ